ncbi:MAG: leucine-rich repeat domain-containing protein [Ruminococcus sp.]|nr:leucine-rich repeat domain-containing protein [Ruminococcus sp.]
MWLWKNLKENPLLIVNGLLVKSIAEGDVVIPQGVRSIANYAFYGCSKLTSITIPESVESIGKEAFKFCTNLSGVTLVSDNDSFTVNSIFGIVNKNGELIMNTRNLLDFLKVDLQEKERIFNETENFHCKVMFAVFLAFNYNNSKAKNFLKTNTFGVIKYFTEIEDCEDIKKILALDSVSHGEINQLIDYASVNKKVKAKIILSSYRNDNFNISNGFDSLFLD